MQKEKYTMLNKKTIFIAAAGVAASVLLFKGIRKVAGTVKEKLDSASSGEDLEDLADAGYETEKNQPRFEAVDCCDSAECCETAGRCEAVRGER